MYVRLPRCFTPKKKAKGGAKGFFSVSKRYGEHGMEASEERWKERSQANLHAQVTRSVGTSRKRNVGYGEKRGASVKDLASEVNIK